MDNNWTNDFKNKMEDYQETAPEGLWTDICDTMDIPHEKKGLFLPTFLRYTGAVAAALFAIGIVFHWNKHSNPGDIDTYLTDAQINSNIYETLETDSDNIENKEISTIALKQPYRDILQSNNIDTPPTPDKAPEEELGGNISESVTTSTDIPTQNKEKQEYYEPSNSSDNYITSDIFGDFEEQDAKKPKKYIVGAIVSGAIGNSSMQTGYATTLDVSELTPLGAVPENDIRMFNRNKDVSSSSKYIQPIKVGIHFKGYISKRWSIGTGVEWSWLRSSLREGSDSYYTTSTRDMHYIGIPLNIGFDIWQGRNLNVYASAGGTMEKCVYARNSVTYIFNHAAGRNDIERFNEKQVQWSISAGVGLEYKFADFAGIHITPGISWHFDNGSGIDNIYKARPFNFALALGFRFYL